jgi:2-polyprenyl-3-methyl-5-hydroxy-6-metoxy-1,4-benzoquinol methylase
MDTQLPAGIEKLERVADGFKIYKALMTAIDLGLFELLETHGPLDKEKIVQSIGINGMFSRPLLNTLIEIGVLTLKDEKYANTDVASGYLAKSSSFYQGDRMQGIAQGGHWNNLSASLKRQQQEMGNLSTGTGPSEPFLKSLAQRALTGELQSVTKAISKWNGFSNAKTILDIGGGHGLYTIALCQTNPQLKGVILDKPNVTPVTQQYIEQYGLTNRITTQVGDICTDGLGSDYDIVIISHLLYKFRKNLDPIFEKVSKCMNMGGLFVSNHWFCGKGCVAENSAIKELGKSLQSFGHPLCHVEDFDNLFKLKGFSIIEEIDVATAFGKSTLHLAVKASVSEKRSDGSCGCCGN